MGQFRMTRVAFTLNCVCLMHMLFAGDTIFGIWYFHKFEKFVMRFGDEPIFWQGEFRLIFVISYNFSLIQFLRLYTYQIWSKTSELVYSSSYLINCFYLKIFLSTK